MSEGLRCVCEHAMHKGSRRPSSLPPEYRVPEPGLCNRYAMDQQRGGLCQTCFDEHPQWPTEDSHAI